MQPALRVWTMLFPPQAADGTFSAFGVGPLEHLFTISGPRACAMKDADGRHKACSIAAWMSGHQEHVPHTYRIHARYRSGQWYKEASAGAELVDPALLNFRGPGVDENGIIGVAGQAAAVATNDRYVCVPAQVPLGTLCEFSVDLDAEHLAAWGKSLGGDGCVVPDATTDVEKTLTRRQVEHIEPSRQRTWLAVVDSSGSINGHKHVIVYMVGVAVRRITVGQIGQHKNFPRTSPDEVFAGNRCQGTHERRRSQACGLAKSLRESRAYAFQIGYHCWTIITLLKEVAEKCANLTASRNSLKALGADRSRDCKERSFRIFPQAPKQKDKLRGALFEDGAAVQPSA